LNVLTMTGMVMLPIILLIAEYRFPTYVLGYANSDQRISDLIFSNLVSLSTLIAMMMLYTRTLKREVSRANHYARQLQMISETDALTSMKNRDYSLKALELAENSGKSFNVIMLDIDNFKDINDTYGHDVGDRVLKHVSSSLKSYCNSYGILASRYGGEEFLIVTFFHTFEQTLRMAECLRIDICDANYLQAKRVTISLGVAKARDNEDYMSVIKRADEALYMSKNAGRNQVSSVES
jgi:diguanylate cyclase (GGDEF)-like protein